MINILNSLILLLIILSTKEWFYFLFEKAKYNKKYYHSDSHTTSDYNIDSWISCWLSCTIIRIYNLVCDYSYTFCYLFWSVGLSLWFCYSTTLSHTAFCCNISIIIEKTWSSKVPFTVSYLTGIYWILLRRTTWIITYPTCVWTICNTFAWLSTRLTLNYWK